MLLVDTAENKLKKELIYGCMGLGGNWNTNFLTTNDLLIAEKAIEAVLESD